MIFTLVWGRWIAMPAIREAATIRTAIEIPAPIRRESREEKSGRKIISSNEIKQKKERRRGDKTRACRSSKKGWHISYLRSSLLSNSCLHAYCNYIIHFYMGARPERFF